MYFVVLLRILITVIFFRKTKLLKDLVNKSTAYQQSVFGLSWRWMKEETDRPTIRSNGDDAGWFTKRTCRRTAKQAEVIRSTARYCFPRVFGRVGRMWIAEWHPLPYRLVLNDVLMNGDW